MSDINPRIIKKALKNADKKWATRPANKIEEIQYTADFLRCLEKLGVEIYSMKTRDQVMPVLKSHLGV